MESGFDAGEGLVRAVIRGNTKHAWSRKIVCVCVFGGGERKRRRDAIRNQF